MMRGIENGVFMKKKGQTSATKNVSYVLLTLSVYARANLHEIYLIMEYRMDRGIMDQIFFLRINRF